MAADSCCAVKYQAAFVNMSQSIFCEFSLLILDDNVLRIVDDHHAASVNKPASFEIFCKVLIEQRFDNGVVPVDNEGLILFQRALGEGERWVMSAHA